MLLVEIIPTNIRGHKLYDLDNRIDDSLNVLGGDICWILDTRLLVLVVVVAVVNNLLGPLRFYWIDSVDG